MPSSHANGSVTTDGTAQTIDAAITTAGTYQLFLECHNMVAGDEVEVWAEMKVVSGSTARKLLPIAALQGPQADPVKMSLPIMAVVELTFKIQRLAGTDRAYNFNIVKA